MNLEICWATERGIHRPPLKEPTKWDSLCCAAVTQSVYNYTFWRMRPLSWETAEKFLNWPFTKSCPPLVAVAMSVKLHIDWLRFQWYQRLSKGNNRSCCFYPSLCQFSLISCFIQEDLQIFLSDTVLSSGSPVGSSCSNSAASRETAHWFDQHPRSDPNRQQELHRESGNWNFTWLHP